MDDEYITREDAIWAACKALCHPGAFCPDNSCIEVRKVFNAIPAADVRPVVRGAWIGIDDFPHEDWECSVCGEQVCGNDSIPRDMHYCPNCGAEMEADMREDG